MTLGRKATKLKPLVAHMLQRKQVDAATGHKGMDPIRKAQPLLWLRGMGRIFWLSKRAKIWFGLLSKETACLSS